MSDDQGMTPQFSVIVINWNGRDYLPRCLEAILAQDYPPREVILVDNGSRDGSVDLVRQGYPAVRLFPQEENLGFAVANNLAAREAGAEWLALLNPDAFPDPGWLRAYAQAIQARPEVGVFTGTLVCAEDQDRLDGTGDIYHVSGVCWRRDHGRRRDQVRRPAGQVFSPCGASTVIRRDLWLELGGFDEDFFCYLEDVDLGFRLRLAGHDCWYVPEALAYHLGSATTGYRSDFSVFQGQRNLPWVYLKNMPGWLFWLYLPGHLLANLWALVTAARRGQGAVAWAAKRAAWSGLPRMWWKRRQVQRRRVVSLARLRSSMATGLAWLRR